MSSKTLVAVDPDFIQELQKQFAEAVEGFKKAVELLKKEQEKSISLELYSAQEAAKYMKVSTSILEYYEKNGLPYYRTCHKGKWYRRGEIDEWLESGAVNRHRRTRKLTLFSD